MARPDQPVLAASRRRTQVLVALLAAGVAATALWIASSPGALPAQRLEAELATGEAEAKKLAAAKKS